MLVLKILGGIFVLFSFLLAITIFDEYCDDKFEHRFFNIKSFIILIVIVAMLIIGDNWYENALRDHGDSLNGLVLMGLGGLILLGLVIYNLSQAGFIFGFIGSVIQVSIFGALALISLPLLAVFAFLYTISIFIPTVYVVK